jgi:hypothetical protein
MVSVAKRQLMLVALVRVAASARQQTTVWLRRIGRLFPSWPGAVPAMTVRTKPAVHRLASDAQSRFVSRRLPRANRRTRARRRATMQPSVTRLGLPIARIVM